ncbi:MAG TPA: SpoIIE family protein phosphatase, partial [Archangium sp.]
LVEFFPGGALLAVVDGLGHGPSAELAARTAVDALRAAPRRSVEELVHACHEGLKRTRGAVMSLASFDVARSTMTWVGVGNVEGVLLRRDGIEVQRERLFVRGGIVGQALPTLRPGTVAVSRDDVIVFATDGLDSSFIDARLAQEVLRGEEVELMARRLLEQHARERDDALVLVGRYRGADS